MASCYRLYYFKSKGAFLLLLWSFSGSYVFHKYVTIQTSSVGLDASLKVWLSSGILLYPLFGWLADARYGRYKVIKCCLYMVWLLTSLHCLIKVAFGISRPHGKINEELKKYSLIAVEAIVIIVLGGFQANIVQLAIDQIPDAPSVEVSSFMRWYGWIWFLSQTVALIAPNCIISGYEALFAFIDPSLFTVMLILDSFCSHWLVKETIFKNPLRVIFEVLKFAYRNKYPPLRSAHCYWNLRRPCRIDVAKSKFGGPFTTDEVESVKSFFRIVMVLMGGSILVSTIVFINDAADKLFLHLKDSDADSPVSEVLWKRIVKFIGTILVTTFFPLLEFFVLPWIRRWLCIKRISFKIKFFAGMVFILVAVINYSTLSGYGHYHTNSSLVNNSICILNSSNVSIDESNKLSLRYEWFIFPSAPYSIGIFLMLTSGGEFICAQSPSSMKGLLFGMVYGIIGLGIFINFTWFYPLQIFLKEKSFSSNSLGCGSIYFMCAGIVLLAICTGIYVSVRCYKKTERNFDQSTGILIADFYHYINQTEENTDSK